MMNETWNVLVGVGLITVVGLIAVGLVREYRDPASYHELYRLLRQTTYEAARAAVELIEARGLLKEYEDGHKANMRLLAARGIEPAWRPARAAKEIVNGGSKLLPLYDLLYDKFSDDELYDLAFRIGLSRDGVDGETHAGKAQCVVEYADRRNVVGELVRIGKGERPELEWPTVGDE